MFPFIERCCKNTQTRNLAVPPAASHLTSFPATWRLALAPRHRPACLPPWAPPQRPNSGGHRPVWAEKFRGTYCSLVPGRPQGELRICKAEFPSSTKLGGIIPLSTLHSLEIPRQVTRDSYLRVESSSPWATPQGDSEGQRLGTTKGMVGHI